MKRHKECFKMMKLYSLKQQMKNKKSSEDSADEVSKTRRHSSAAHLRIQKDINELNLPPACHIDFPDANDFLNFNITICPNEGFYQRGKFLFNFKVGEAYPHEPPKVKCLTTVYHPNIDLSGNICLNILREDWKPVLSINSIIYGLQFLMLEPNPNDPLNKEAAQELKTNQKLLKLTSIDQ